MSEKEFEDLMRKHGWTAIRDVFKNIVEWRRGKTVIGARDARTWQRLGRTPPPW